MNREDKLEMIKWQMNIEQQFKTMLEGCLVLVETDTAISDRVDFLSDRLDIANRRLRKIEQINKLLMKDHNK